MGGRTSQAPLARPGQMMVVSLLGDIALLFGVVLVAVWASRRIRLPSIFAFLLAGILTGPEGRSIRGGVPGTPRFCGSSTGWR